MYLHNKNAFVCFLLSTVFAGQNEVKMFSERAVFRPNQRASLDHDARCQRLLLHNVVINVCDRQGNNLLCDSYLVLLVLRRGQVLRKVFFWNIDTHSPPRNANNTSS